MSNFRVVVLLRVTVDREVLTKLLSKILEASILSNESGYSKSSVPNYDVQCPGVSVNHLLGSFSFAHF